MLLSHASILVLKRLLPPCSSLLALSSSPTCFEPRADIALRLIISLSAATTHVLPASNAIASAPLIAANMTLLARLAGVSKERFSSQRSPQQARFTLVATTAARSVGTMTPMSTEATASSHAAISLAPTASRRWSIRHMVTSSRCDAALSFVFFEKS